MAGHRFRVGLAFALTSALAFGFSGPFAKALITAGWTPTAAVTARLAAGALLMAVFATVVRRRWWREAATHGRTVVMYGVAPIAGAQVCYYNAVAHLPVGIALLLEYLAPVLVVAYLWLTTRHRPATLTLAGAALAVAGIALVLDVIGGAGTGRIDPVGVVWGLGAAVCAACYFLLSERAAGAPDGGLHPITLATGGLIVGAAVAGSLGALGVLPMRFTAHDTVVAGYTTSPAVPVAALAVVATAVAYTLGIVGIARLRPGFASLVGLSEVLFAVLAAWVLLGEGITATQAAGGLVVLGGLALARIGDRSDQSAATPELPDTDAVDAAACR
ncbi:EamA family transporter [Mycobacterium sp. MYCO198283]|uniref:EamA family transporter n=1 Tax=Mycobacterium sp. MYCO198283 TaxID=2883505 RepID=UPI001E5C6C62|nr:EamA family transporter [Mycobacterium sp. MYCO198283]MCG5431814.1 EamA family transporter [Mycobacterium sp. MYCO198283]